MDMTLGWALVVMLGWAIGRSNHSVTRLLIGSEQSPLAVDPQSHIGGDLFKERRAFMARCLWARVVLFASRARGPGA
jgi:hypothetical protein